MLEQAMNKAACINAFNGFDIAEFDALAYDARFPVELLDIIGEYVLSPTRLTRFEVTDAMGLTSPVDDMTVGKMIEYIPRDDLDDEHHYDSMDGDHASALASAGFGTDEDYGHFHDELERDWDESYEG